MKRFLSFILFLGGLFNYGHGQVVFQDMAPVLGVDHVGKNYGVAFADYNNDGREDILVYPQLERILLYEQQMDGSFLEKAQEVGIEVYPSMHGMCVWGDINNDGWLDLFVSSQTDDHLLFLNNGDATFSEIGYTAGVYQGNKVRAALFADIDQDGFLDLYLARLNQENILYKNNGDLTFTDVTEASGALDQQISMGAVFLDYDNDGDPDLYLTHDGNQANILYQNDGSGHFTDVSESSGTNVAGEGMGVDFGDINNDGWLDLYITNRFENTLLLNNADGTFSNISESAAIMDLGMGWGTTFLDFNNDGWQDIYVVNDSYFSPEPNLMYQNMGDNTFTLVSEGTIISSMEGSYGVATSDVNRDGQVDVFVNNRGGSVGNQLLINQSNADNHWVNLQLTGTISNRSAIGARVQIICGEDRYTDEVAGGSGYASQNSLTLHFGLGEHEVIDQLFIRWPNGLEESYEQVAVDQTYAIVENQDITPVTVTVVPTQEVLGPTNIRVFPNPFSESFKIVLNEALAIDHYAVYDAFGQERLREVAPTGQEWMIHLPSLPAGSYCLKITTERGVISRKVICQNRY